MVYIRHDNYKHAVTNEAMKVSKVVLLHNTQCNDDWIIDTSQIVNNVDRCAVVNEAMIVSNLLHNAQFNDDWTKWYLRNS